MHPTVFRALVIFARAGSYVAVFAIGLHLGLANRMTVTHVEPVIVDEAVLVTPAPVDVEAMPIHDVPAAEEVLAEPPAASYPEAEALVRKLKRDWALSREIVKAKQDAKRYDKYMEQVFDGPFPESDDE